MTLTLEQICLLLSAGGITGAINGVAAGGSLISFPSLIFVGLPPLQANATNNTITWIGHITSAYAYRRDWSIKFKQLVVLALISLIGGWIGAMLLLKTPQTLFIKLVPYLLLGATVLFAFSPQISRWVHARQSKQAKSSLLIFIIVSILHFMIAIYGGFFGGGSGVMMLANFSLLGMKSIHSMNALKAMLNSCVNTVALITFLSSHIIDWQVAFVMSCGSFLGSYGGVYIIHKLDPKLVRRFITLVGLSLTVHFFMKSV